MVDQADSIRAHGLRYLHERVCAEHSMLIVDDVYSTGSSVNAVIEQLSRKSWRNLPHDIRIATVWYRPTEKTIRAPEFYVHETADYRYARRNRSGRSVFLRHAAGTQRTRHQRSCAGCPYGDRVYCRN